MSKLTILPELVKTKWIEALRSGKYKQTTETLQDGTGLCCLGVLCKVAQNEDIKVDTCGTYVTGEDLSSSQYDVYEWSGLNSTTETDLEEMNDNGENFNTIADFIEEYL
tara:strand:- start:16973 stop:17299 length:327 start_codon:yes stop_codon:yes gene_type:complete